METTISMDKTPTLEALQTKLDELRVRIHLGGLDAHDRFEALRREVVALGRKATRVSKIAATRLRERIEELEAMLIVRD
jgi:hypothetical protein